MPFRVHTSHLTVWPSRHVRAGETALKPVCQQMPRAMQPRPHRPERAAERLRGVGVAHALQVAQHHDFPIPGRQTHDRAAQLLHVALPDQLVVGAGRRVAQTEIRFALVQPDEEPIAQEPSARVMSRGSVEICRQRRARRVVPRRIAHERQKHVLDDVLGGRRRAGHQPCEAVDRGVMRPIQRRECIAVAGGRSPHQVTVGGRSRIAHSGRDCRRPGKVPENWWATTFGRWRVNSRRPTPNVQPFPTPKAQLPWEFLGFGFWGSWKSGIGRLGIDMGSDRKQPIEIAAEDKGLVSRR